MGNMVERALSSRFASIIRAVGFLLLILVQFSATLILVTRDGCAILLATPSCMMQVFLSFTEEKDFSPTGGTAIHCIPVCPTFAATAGCCQNLPPLLLVDYIVANRVQYKTLYV